MNLKERIDFIFREYDRRIKNDIFIPDWLEKQHKAVNMLDNRDSLFLLQEGLMEEREWITSLLMNAE